MPGRAGCLTLGGPDPAEEEAVPNPVIAAVDPGDVGGLTGWVAGVIEATGELGVGLLVALESIIPPIPSEVVLAMAG